MCLSQYQEKWRWIIWMYYWQSHRQVLIIYPILNKSYVILCMYMHIYVISTLIHHGRGGSKHTTVISFLLPRLINNSWVTIAGGESWGEEGDTQRSSPWEGSPQNQEEEFRAWNHSVQQKAAQWIPHTCLPLWRNVDHLHYHHHWHYRTLQAFLCEAITFSFSSLPMLVSE